MGYRENTYQTAIAQAAGELREAVKGMRDALSTLLAAPVLGLDRAQAAAREALERYDRAVIDLDRARSAG